MTFSKRRLATLALLTGLLAAALFAVWVLRAHLPTPVAERLGLRADISQIRARVLPRLTADLATQGLAPGAPAYIRIFKEESELELYLHGANGPQLFKTYPICNWSGTLGPKLREGDGQSPEGIYHVTKQALNPASSYHLSFNLGFPNAFDRAQGRTGSFLMVHGRCLSVGCYAMTDPAIEEIYLLVEAALTAGQPAVPVHAFPFRMTKTRLARAAQNEWAGFWQDLALIHDAFETTGQVPEVGVRNGRYHLSTP